MKTMDVTVAVSAYLGFLFGKAGRFLGSKVFSHTPFVGRVAEAFPIHALVPDYLSHWHVDCLA